MASISDSIAKFDKLALRERVLATLAVAVVLYFVMDIALLGPQQNKLKELRRLDQAHQAELASVNKVLAEMTADPTTADDAHAQQRAMLASLKQQIAEADAFLAQTDTNDSQLGGLLRNLLASNPGLIVVSMNTLPVTAFDSSPGDSNNKVTKPLYRQGVEIGVKGDYLTLLAYLRNLEHYPKRLFWSDAKLEVPTYPDAVLRVRIYTLSDQPESALR